MPSAESRTQSSYYKFLLVLVGFLVIADALIISQVYVQSIEQRQTQTDNEAMLFARLISETLTKGDYANVEYAVSIWGIERDDLARITITAANGFTLAQYEREQPATQLRHYQDTIEYGSDRFATIHLDTDVSDIYTHLTWLVVQLLVFSVLLVALLGFFLRQVAIRPLQHEVEERRRTEKELERHTRALTISNQELEAFSYTVAHDLRAPLRAMTSFSMILKEDAVDKLNDNEIRCLDRIIKSGRRMALLIDDLLELARISRTEMHLSCVDLSKLATQAIKHLQEADLDREVACSVQTDLFARGDASLLQIVVDNLIGNAWKYSSTSEDVRITFGVTKDKSNGTVFCVSDNGVGFDMQYVGKVFESFQRLHSADEFPGTGVGLASVQRAIARHGGRIWAEAEVGKGAAFYFTLSQT